MLRVTGISKSYGNHLTLNQVNFDLSAGQIATLIGPSGCGKSTLLRAASLVDPPSAGVVQIGSDEFTFPSSARRIRVYPKLTIVFQHFQLWFHLTIRQNIMLPIQKAVDEHRYAHFQELTEYFEITRLLDRYPHQISIGQRQRVALVRAVILDPEILLLDEITSALDIEQIDRLRVWLLHRRDPRMTILLASHLIGFAKRVSDVVYFMDEGTIVESGSAEMLENPTTLRLKKFVSLM